MNFLTPVAVRVGRISWLPRYLRYIVAIDRLIHRLTRNRFGLMLTVRGRRSGVPRTTPLLCTAAPGESPHRRLQLGHPEASRVGAQHTGMEREQIWEVLVRGWPNYVKYAERTGRVIPIFELTPQAADSVIGLQAEV